MIRRYRLTQSPHGSWHIEVRRWLIWWTIDIRSGLDRAVERLRAIAGGEL